MAISMFNDIVFDFKAVEKNMTRQMRRGQKS
jgi:hypothetical protein